MKSLELVVVVALLTTTLFASTTIMPFSIYFVNAQENNSSMNNQTINSTSPIEEFNIGEHEFTAPLQLPHTGTLGNYTIQWPNIHSNVKTDFDPVVVLPEIEETAFIHPFAIVIGDCHIGKMLLVAPTAVCRGDEGTPIKIGDFSNIQDGVVLHGLETFSKGKNLDERRYSQDGQKLLGNDPLFTQGYSVFVGDRVSLAHDSMVHGPAWIGNNTFVGMDSLVFNAKVGNNVSIGVSSTITGGVEIADNRFVPPGSVIVTQEQADALPSRIGSPLEKINDAVIQVNEALAEGYDHQSLDEVVRQREANMEQGMMETSMPDGNVTSTQS